MRQQGDRVFLTFDEARSLLPSGDTVHTFINPAAGVLVGADWDRTDLLDLMRSCPDAECAEVTGEQAQAVGHGLAVHHTNGSLLYVEAARWRAPREEAERG